MLCEIYKQQENHIPSVIDLINPPVYKIKTVPISKPKKIVYSKSRRQQILFSDMASIIIIAYEDMMIDPEPAAIEYIKMIKKELGFVKNHLNINDRFYFDPKDIRKYHRTMHQIEDVINDFFGEGASLTLDYILATIQLMTDNLDLLHSKQMNAKYIEHWEKITSLFQDLYEHYDENLEKESCFTNGSEVAKRIWKIISES